MFKLYDKKPSIINSKRELLNLLFSNTNKIYLMGINQYSNELISIFNKDNIKIEGMIDDFTDELFYQDIPIYRSENVGKDSIVIVCVLDARLYTAIQNIKANGLYNILTYFDLVLYDQERFKQVEFFKENIADIEDNLLEYQWLYNQLDDDDSKKTLENIVDFRYNMDAETLKNFSYRLDEQYFDIIQFDNKESFVDAGAFDGKTTQKFIELSPDYEKVYVFEPSGEHFQQTYNLLQEFPNIKFYQNAISKENTTVLFDSQKGSASSLSDNGDIMVTTVRLDDVIKDKITFMKFDVEGAEYDSLIGAEKIIRKHKPKLAVCVYHNQADFWRIPRLLLRYNPNYRIRLRHYTEGILETVMYFI